MTTRFDWQAAEAIQQSVRENRIVHLSGGDRLVDELLALSSDSAFVSTDVDGRKLVELWGVDDYGNDWRVHVHAAG